MGCKASKADQNEELHKIKYLIDADNENGLMLFLKQEISIKNKLTLVNEIRIDCQNRNFSLLGYSLFKGKGKCFVCLVKMFKADLEEMFDQFRIDGLDPIQFACENLQLLETLYPRFIQKAEFEQWNMPVTPIQVACLSGNLASVHFILNYKQGPKAFASLELANNEGKNVVALALEQGIYSVFKYLAEKCPRIVGIPDPIAFCLQHHSQVKGKEYLECAMYIIQTLRVPVQKLHLGWQTSCVTFNSFLLNKFQDGFTPRTQDSIESFSTQHSF